MASEVDIANLALAHIGDSATVASLNPPEGSAQAEHCARFYPVARDALLEMAGWGFAMRRAKLAQVAQPWTEWQYAYAMPAGVVNVLSILPADATDDYEDTFGPQSNVAFPPGYIPVPMSGHYTPQPYTIETNDSGQLVIYTNVEKAVLRYSVKVTDTTLFGPLFTLALSWLLASMIAGPIIKGDTGAAEGERCLKMFMAIEAQAETSDASQRSVKPQHLVPWIAGR